MGRSNEWFDFSNNKLNLIINYVNVSITANSFHGYNYMKNNLN
jgi:hypothetical protein